MGQRKGVGKCDGAPVNSVFDFFVIGLVEVLFHMLPPCEVFFLT